MSSPNRLPRVLIVEDHVATQKLIQRSLELASMETALAGSLADARAALARGAFDLILLDVELPDGEGQLLCRDLQASEETRSVPVLFLTGRSDVDTRISAFAAGADDYVQKPFDPRELRARVEARLRKAPARAPKVALQLQAGPFLIDLQSQKLFAIEPDGARRQLDVTPHEFRLLNHLARHEGRAFTRHELLEAVWGAAVHITDRTVDSHVAGLRRKLGALASHVQAVPGTGYRFSITPKKHKKAS